MPLPIEDYAFIGDCETAGLVGQDGSIDWLCWPRFDFDACFAALLGSPDHGRWLIAPVSAAERPVRRYWGDTLILETCFETVDGGVPTHRLHATEGRSLKFGPRRPWPARQSPRCGWNSAFALATAHRIPWVNRQEDCTLRFIAGADQAVLRTSVPLRREDLKTVGDFTIAEGETVALHAHLRTIASAAARPG